MSACSTPFYGNLIYLAEMPIIPFHSAGMARLRVDWHSPDWLASVLRSNVGRSSAHSSRRIAHGNLKPLMSQSPSCASKSSLSLNTRSLRIAPFAKSFITAKADIVFNGMHVGWHSELCSQTMISGRFPEPMQ